MSTEKLQTPFYRVKEKDLLYDINLLKEALLKEDTLEKAAKDLEAEIAAGNEN